MYIFSLKIGENAEKSKNRISANLSALIKFCM
jgi:hypothetical protein